MENKNFTVGDFVFLFYVESGIISSGRILEKTIRETISNGLNTEYVLEVYNKEGNHIETKKVKFDGSNFSIFSSIEELRIELHEHVMSVVNNMIEDCNETYNIARKLQEQNENPTA